MFPRPLSLYLILASRGTCPENLRMIMRLDFRDPVCLRIELMHNNIKSLVRR